MPSNAKLPFTIGTLRKAVPAHCFERSMLRSSLYLLADLTAVVILLIACLHIDRLPWWAAVFLWPAYWFCQVTPASPRPNPRRDTPANTGEVSCTIITQSSASLTLARHVDTCREQSAQECGSLPTSAAIRPSRAGRWSMTPSGSCCPLPCSSRTTPGALPMHCPCITQVSSLACTEQATTDPGRFPICAAGFAGSTRTGGTTATPAALRRMR